MARSQDRIKQTTSSDIQPPERTCLLIAGMHRSGTSALARVLSLLGADLPRTLMEGSEANRASNAKGHWESEPMARLSDMVLDSAGTDWRSPEPVATSWYRSARFREMREKAVELLQEEFGRSPFFVFKDPRVCKLMPFWLDALDHFGATPRVVSILRSPLEVAASLHARNGFDLSIGQLLWLRYVLDAEIATRATSRVFVTYDRLLENAAEVTAQIGTSLDLVWPCASLKTDGAIAGFLSASQRHHSHELDRTTGSQRGLTPLLADVYAIVTRWANEGEAASDRVALDRSREELDRALVLLGEPVALALHQGSQLRRFKGHDKERDAQFKAIEDQVRVSEEKTRVAEAQAMAARREVESHQAETQAQLEDVHRQVNALEVDRAKAIEECQNARIAEARLTERLTAVDAARTAAVNSCIQLEARLEKAESRQTEALDRLEDARRQVDVLEAARAKMVEECQSACIAAARLEERLAAIDAARTTALRSCEQLEAKLDEARLSSEALLAQVHATQLDQVRNEAKIAALELELRLLAGVAHELEQARSKLHQLERECAHEQQVAKENARKFEARTTQLEALRVEHGYSIEARKATGAQLDELRRENAAISAKLTEQQRIAGDRQAAIEHLREDRARRVAERDERNRKLEIQVDDLHRQLSMTHVGDRTHIAKATLAARMKRWLRLPGAQAAQRRAMQLERLRAAEFFNGSWYLAKYEDVRVGGLDPAEHYLDHGGAEGRSPGPNFDGRWYLEANPDVREAGINPLLHYLEHGRDEGRESRSLAASKRLRMFADAPAGAVRSTRDTLRFDHRPAISSSVELASRYGAPRPSNRDRSPTVTPNELVAVPAAPANAAIEPVAEEGAWSARGLSFSALSAFADLDRDITGITGAADGESHAPVLVGDTKIARDGSRSAASGAMAACRWSAWLRRIGPRPDDINVPPPTDALADALRLSLCGGELTLVDAWFASPTELHLRFHAKWGIAVPVLRSYQPDTAGRWSNCGDAAIAGAGETIIRLRLLARFAPLLLALIDAAGDLVDSTLLVFPSLCRGGAHFGELAALPRNAGMLVAAREKTLDLLGKYLAVTTGNAPTGLSHIAIGIDGANGTEPAFESDLLDWLVSDLGMTVTVRAAMAENPSGAAIGAEVAARGSPLTPRLEGVCLELPPRAVPTLSALFASRGDLVEGVCRAIYLDADSGHAHYGLECRQPTELTKHLAPAQGESMPRLYGGMAGVNAGNDYGAESVGSVDLAICWPAAAPVAAQAFFPSGAANLGELSKASLRARRLSVVIDGTGGQTDISALLISIDALRNDFEIESVIVCRAPEASAILPTTPQGLTTALRFVTVSGQAGPQRLAKALQAGDAGDRADRVLVLDETVVLHDARVAGVLWSACEADGVGSASCPLVSEVAQAKGRMRVYQTAGWVMTTDLHGTSRFALIDLTGYVLPAVLPVVAPDLRCAMVDTARLIASGAAGDDELGFGLSLGSAGLPNLCITSVAATASVPRSDQVAIETNPSRDRTLPHGALHIRSLRP